MCRSPTRRLRYESMRDPNPRLSLTRPLLLKPLWQTVADSYKSRLISNLQGHAFLFVKIFILQNTVVVLDATNSG